MKQDDFFKVLRNARTGTLCLMDFEHQVPFGTLVNVATDEQNHPLFLFSGLSRHSKSLLASAGNQMQGSLLVADPLPSSGDALTGLRGTMIGRFEKTQDGDVAEAYLAKHPYAKMYAQFGDFSFWRMLPRHVYVVGGFGNVFDFAFA